jgi:hypothetical protein
MTSSGQPGGGIPNDPGQYPGRPSAGAGFFHRPGCQGASGGTCYCFGGPMGPARQLTPEQGNALSRRNMLGVVNGVVIFPLLICLGLWIAEAGVHHHAASTLYGIVSLVIIVAQIRNKMVKCRIMRKYDFK